MTLQEIAKEITTQDNRSTSHPVFTVMDHDKNKKTPVHMESFFTQKGADEFIELNRHNLYKPYVYIASGYKNPEWIAVRALLKALPDRIEAM